MLWVCVYVCCVLVRAKSFSIWWIQLNVSMISSNFPFHDSVLPSNICIHIIHSIHVQRTSRSRIFYFLCWPIPCRRASKHIFFCASNSSIDRLPIGCYCYQQLRYPSEINIPTALHLLSNVSWKYSSNPSHIYPKPPNPSARMISPRNLLPILWAIQVFYVHMHCVVLWVSVSVLLCVCPCHFPPSYVV